MSNKLSNANFIKWFRPLVQALKDLGGSATPKDAIAQIVKNENLDDATLNEIRGKTGMKKFNNEIAWVRQYLVYAGMIDNSKRGMWTLTDTGKDVEMTEEVASQIFRKQWREDKDKIDFTHWYPLHYSPKISVETWVNLLKNPNIFNAESLQVMARLKELGGMATCSELSEYFGETWNFYNVTSQHLAKRIAKETNCQVDRREDGSPRWWSLLYLGKDALPNQKGSYVWKID